MKQALPHTTRFPPSSSSTVTITTMGGDSRPPPSNNNNRSPTESGPSLQKLVAENAVIVFGRRGCCMCHVVKRLLVGLGANPPIEEVDEDEEEAVIGELSRICGGDDGEAGQGIQFPAVFVRGKLFGGLEKLMATHISGELVPILKEAGAIWL